jgi:hypothetical protein
MLLLTLVFVSFSGPRCEFTSAEDAKCSLTCQNGGSCRSGLKDEALVNALGKEMSHFNSSRSGLFEHCVCPDGFFGIQCEHKLEICPGGDHVCLHGSKCVAENESAEDNSEITQKCDCEHSFDAVGRYAGKFCQYSSTDICTKTGQPGVGKANFAFCVNNGSCKAKVDDNEAHPGCHCGAEFSGEHCEFLKSSTEGTQPPSTQPPVFSTSTTTSSNSGSDTGVIAVSVTLMVVIVVAGFFVLRALCCSGDRIRRGKSDGADVGAAVAEEEAASNGMSDDRKLSINGTGATRSYDDGAGELDDLEDYSNASTLTEGGMTNVQIV